MEEVAVRRIHPDRVKRLAARVWLATGSRKKACQKTGVPINTLNDWIYQQWWKDTIEDLRRDEKTKIAAKLQKLAVKSYEVVDDRLDNGDWIVNSKTGELQRKPVDAKIASRIGADALDRAQKWDPKTEEQTQTTVAQLSDLAKRFEALARKSKPKVEVTDVIIMEKNTNEPIREEVQG